MRITGRWAFLWPETGWHDEAWLKAKAAKLHSMGFDGVILHCGMDAAHQAAVHVEVAKTRADLFRDAGLEVAVGLGFPKPSPAQLPHVVDGILAAIRGGFEFVALDWEGAWSGHKADAKLVVDQVLAALGGMPSCPVTSLCWWAPLTLPSGGGTHPSAPTSEFLRLTAFDVPVCPQTYNGGHDGDTTSQLAWSRHQYAQFGQWPIVPTIQAYKHSIADRVAFLLAELTALCWDLLEFDANFEAALAFVKKLEAHGFHSVRDFQASVPGLTTDGVFGPKTQAAADSL